MSLWRSVGYGLARFQEEPFNFFYEWFGLVIAEIVWVAATRIQLDIGTILLAPVLVIVLQAALVSNVSRLPGYVLFLARRAGAPRRSKPRPVDSYWAFDHHMKAMKRLGTFLVGDIDDLIRAAMPEHLESTQVPGSHGAPDFDQVAYCIRSSLRDQAADLSPNEANKPYARYASILESAFEGETLAFKAWRRFLIARYEEASSRWRELAVRYARPSVMGAIERHPRFFEVLLYFLASVVALVVWIFSGFRLAS